MKALLLAAGLGTRLKPFTFLAAKATLPLLNLPFVHYPLQFLFHNRIEEIVINLHAFPESVKKAAGGSYRGTPLHYSHEPMIMGTAGAMASARPMLGDEPFVVMNGDTLLDVPLEKVVEQHLFSGAVATLVVMDSIRFSHFAGLYFNDTDSLPRLTGFVPGNGKPYHYTGLQIVDPEVVKSIPTDRSTDIFRDIYPMWLKHGARICGYIYDGLWMEMGSLGSYLRTTGTLLEHPFPQHLQPPGLRLSSISPNAEIQPGAIVRQSIVMEGATIKFPACVQHSIVGWNVTVEHDIRNVALARGILPWRF